MRDILFRGKNTDTCEWVYGSFYPNSDGRTYIIEKMEDLTIHKVHPDTVGQYTGLTDKNGNKIFEGAIVKWTRHNVHIEGKPLQTFVNYCKIYYDEKRHGFYMWFELDCGSASGKLNFDDERAQKVEIEVVGNIFDTPELLKGGEE